MGSYTRRFWSMLGQTTPPTVAMNALNINMDYDPGLVKVSFFDEKNHKENNIIEDYIPHQTSPIVEEKEEEFFDFEEKAEEDVKDYSHLRIHTPYSVAKARIAYYKNPVNYISLEGPGMVKDLVEKPYEGYKFLTSTAIIASLAYTAYAAPVVLFGTASPFAALYAYNAIQGEEGVQAFSIKSAIGLTAYASSVTAAFLVSPYIGMGIALLATQNYSQQIVHKTVKLATGYDLEKTTLWGSLVVGLTSHFSANALEATVNQEPESWFSFNGFVNNVYNSSKQASVGVLRQTSSLASAHFFSRFEATTQDITDSLIRVVTFPTMLYSFYKTSAEQSEILNNEILAHAQETDSKARIEEKECKTMLAEFVDISSNEAEEKEVEFFECEKEEIAVEEELEDDFIVINPHGRSSSIITPSIATPVKGSFTQKIVDERVNNKRISVSSAIAA